MENNASNIPAANAAPAATAASGINPSVLANFQAAAAGIHAQFANTLAQAGLPVTEQHTASQLINAAAQASSMVGKPFNPGTAPNYADFALQGFLHTMEQLAIQFAAQHLPDRLKPVLADLSAGVQTALGGVKADAPVLAKDVTEIAAAAVSVADPAAAPIVAAAEPVAEAIESAVLGEPAPTTQPIAETLPAVGEPVEAKASLLGDDTH
jgi:hypothetical protein